MDKEDIGAFFLENMRIIISVIIVIVIASVIFCFTKKFGENEPVCENYRHQSVQQIPAGCLQYFQSPNESRITR